MLLLLWELSAEVDSEPMGQEVDKFGKNGVFTGSSSENAKSKTNWKFQAKQANSINPSPDPIRKRNAEPDEDEDEDNKYGTDFC